MKKYITIAVLLLTVISVPALARINNWHPSEKCMVNGCTEDTYEGSPYCRYHKCGIIQCSSRREVNGALCSYHRKQQNQRLKERNSRKSSVGNTYQSASRSSVSGRTNSRRRSIISNSSGSGKTSFDPDDHDIESYYEDYRDEYDDYDDAYDGFLDDDDAWDDY